MSFTKIENLAKKNYIKNSYCKFYLKNKVYMSERTTYMFSYNFDNQIKKR